MTEDEWVACADPKPMLEFLRGKTSDRKLRLFACIELRRRPLPPDILKIADVAERMAEGEPIAEIGLFADYYHCDPSAWKAAEESLYGFALGHMKRQPWHVAYLRCVFGNPFRPVTLDPAWLTSDVLLLARGIYADRAFDRMPILADALQDAGCDNDDMLTHCRGPGPHARGCWVVDLLTGRE